MPLDMTENQIEWQLTQATKGGKQIVQVHGYRISQARLLKDLSPSLIDSRHEISRAYEDRSKGMGYASLGAKTADLNASGGGVDRTEEMIDAIRKRIDRLNRWENLCTAFLRDTVYALDQFGHTASSYAAFKNLWVNEEKTKSDVLTITSWYKEGLRVYAKLNGLE